MIQYFCSGISLSCHCGSDSRPKASEYSGIYIKAPNLNMQERRSWNKGSLFIILWFHTRFGWCWFFECWIHISYTCTHVFAGGVCVCVGGGIEAIPKTSSSDKWAIKSMYNKWGLCHFKLEITKRMEVFRCNTLNQGCGLQPEHAAAATEHIRKWVNNLDRVSPAWILGGYQLPLPWENTKRLSAVGHVRRMHG